MWVDVALWAFSFAALAALVVVVVWSEHSTDETKDDDLEVFFFRQDD